MSNIFLYKYRGSIRAAADKGNRDETAALNRFVVSAQNHGIEGRQYDYENEFPDIDFGRVKAEFDLLGLEKLSEMIREYDAQLGRECGAVFHG